MSCVGHQVSSEEDETLSGDCDGEPNRFRQSTLAVKTRTATRVKEDLLGGCCFVCEETAGPCELSKTWRGIQMHGECWNVVRCHHRLLDIAQKGAAERELFTREPGKWRAQLAPLVAGRGQRTSVVRER